MKRRQGFTLVELLVAMALIIFIMAILSQAFVAAMTVFRNLKGQGDMAEKLRSVTQVLQRDLAADHFEGKKRLSNINFWLKGPPQQGFFQIYQGSPSYWNGVAYPILTVPPNPPPLRNFLEAQPGFGDASLIDSYRSIDHALAFTVKLRGNQMGDFFSASGGMSALSGLFGPAESRYQTITSGGSYNYQWAAVAWFMQPQINPTTTTQDFTVTDPSTGAAPVPLFTLHRRQALLVPDNNLVTPAVLAANIGNFTELSCWVNGANVYFNSPIDITVPNRRFWGNSAAYTASPLTGSDIQLNDVISFDVRLLVPGVTNAVNPNDPLVTLWQFPFNTLNTAVPPGINNGNSLFYPTNILGPMVFDTWTGLSDSINPGQYLTWNAPNLATSIPMWNGTSGPIIQALQISIRIWDFKTNQTRQVTIVQAM